MKPINGKILILTGICHSIFGVLPFAFGKQFSVFSEHFFFKVSDGLSEFPLLGGTMNYEGFAAFWFFYFGLLIIPLGFLVRFIEEKEITLPSGFILSYFIVVLIGVYMIPFSGMTIFMLPHATYMLIANQKK